MIIMLKLLKEEVCQANLELVRRGIVIYTWGNVSGIDREHNVVVIKPSGINYNTMTADDMVVVDLHTGEVVEGKWRPSSDTPTHLELYRAFKNVGGITHTHSVNAVAFAQAGKDIEVLGTTHADYFYGAIPCTRELVREEVENNYEINTGKVIIETIKNKDYDPMIIPGVIVKNHGPFTWGNNAMESVHNAVVMETIAKMNIKTILLNANSEIKQYIIDKHYNRKHGKGAYYGQK